MSTFMERLPSAAAVTAPAPKIDLDRGVMIKKHFGLELYVYMYRDQPGIYLNENGLELPEAIALEAGFDVAKFGRERNKSERMHRALADVDEALEAATAGKVLAEKGGFRIVSAGLGRATVEETDGSSVLTPLPLPEVEAIALLKALLAEKA